MWMVGRRMLAIRNKGAFLNIQWSVVKSWYYFFTFHILVSCTKKREHGLVHRIVCIFSIFWGWWKWNVGLFKTVFYGKAGSKEILPWKALNLNVAFNSCAVWWDTLLIFLPWFIEILYSRFIIKYRKIFYEST